MKDFAPRDENYELRVRESFAKQNLMKTIGARLTKVLPGEVEISLEFRDDLTQQHGFLHAGWSPPLPIPPAAMPRLA